MYHMVIEQTKKYPKRMKYDAENHSFSEAVHYSLGYRRNVPQPYGWIKETGTPPEPHWDVILMTDAELQLGDEVEIRVIGIFIRNDGDHKMVAVPSNREINDFVELTHAERDDLSRLYPRIDTGEGWFGRAVAEKTMAACEKPL